MGDSHKKNVPNADQSSHSTERNQNQIPSAPSNYKPQHIHTMTEPTDVPISVGELILPSDGPDLKRRKKPNLQLQIPSENSTVVVNIPEANMLPTSYMTSPAPTPQTNIHHSLLRTASITSDSSAAGGPTSLVSPIGYTTVATPSSAGMQFLIPQFNNVMLSPTLPFSPQTQSNSASFPLRKISSVELDEVDEGSEKSSVKVIPERAKFSYNLSRTESLTSVSSAPHAVRWNSLDTPGAGHYIPFLNQPLISPTPTAAPPVPQVQRQGSNPMYLSNNFGISGWTNVSQPRMANSTGQAYSYYDNRGQGQQQDARYPYGYSYGYPQAQHVPQPQPQQQQPRMYGYRSGGHQPMYAYATARPVHRDHKQMEVLAGTNPTPTGPYPHSHVHHARSAPSKKTVPGMQGSPLNGSVGSNGSAGSGRAEQFYDMKMKAKNLVGSMPVCRHWMKGTCWYGATCKFRHPEEEEE